MVPPYCFDVVNHLNYRLEFGLPQIFGIIDWSILVDSAYSGWFGHHPDDGHDPAAEEKIILQYLKEVI